MTDTQTGTMRDKIATIIECDEFKPNGFNGPISMADAIIAALPDMLRADPSILRGMVKPLAWSDTYAIGSCGEYQAMPHGQKYYAMTFRDLGGPTYMGIFSDEQAAKAAAEEHNIATVLAAMGVTE